MSTTATPSPDTILTFTAAAGWSTAPDPRPPDCCDGIGFDALFEAGWRHLSDWPDADMDTASLTLEMLRHSERGYLTFVWQAGHGTPVYCPDLPDHLAFLRETLPIVEAIQRLDERAERVHAKNMKEAERRKQQADARQISAKCAANAKMWRERSQQRGKA